MLKVPGVKTVKRPPRADSKTASTTVDGISIDGNAAKLIRCEAKAAKMVSSDSEY